ncbi:SPX domain-containing protein [Gongronella butleri]|nr:SPX domain-containing protein [Gongronella butleri]
MKFAKVLETESIPEWRKAYIQYKGLKKRLKSVDRIRKACEHKAALEMVNPAFQDDDDIDHSQFGCCPSSAWQLWRPSTTVTMIRQWTSSHKGGDIQIPCSRSVSMQSTMALTLWDEVLLHANDAERQFFALLDRELDKVSVFYNDKEGEAKTKFQSLKVQIKLIADYGQHLLEIGPPFSSYPALFQSRQQRLSKVPSFVGYSSDPHISYSVARNRLKKALTEYYRSLEFLSSYRVRRDARESGGLRQKKKREGGNTYRFLQNLFF